MSTLVLGAFLVVIVFNVARAVEALLNIRWYRKADEREAAAERLREEKYRRCLSPEQLRAEYMRCITHPHDCGPNRHRAPATQRS